MRRADRLYRLIEFMRTRKRVIRGMEIAEAMEVSLSTVYRDIADLMASGVPIVGERGVGYILESHYHVPPLMFDLEEIEAIALGLAMVRSWSDPEMKVAADQVMAKIGAVLPEERTRYLQDVPLFSEQSAQHLPWTIDFAMIRHAVRERRKVSLDYSDDGGRPSQRIIWPLGLAFFAPVWLLVAWCEKRDDFRNFRIDRMISADRLEDIYPDAPGRRLMDYLKTIKEKSLET
ncbi:MAG: YafY family transcriptional regulator [Rhodospirillales bacterium]|nr:YafY family transcriptional regulator [Rhodospirillales bacterium]